MVRRWLPVSVLLLMAIVEIGCCRHRCWLQRRHDRIEHRMGHHGAPACDCGPSYYPPGAVAPPVIIPHNPAGTAIPTKMPSIPMAAEQLPGPKPGPMPNL